MTVPSGRGWWWAATATLTAAALLEWGSFAWFTQRPPTDGANHRVLQFLWHHTTDWWTALTFAAASAFTLILMIAVALGRWVSGSWRWVVTTLSVGAWLATPRSQRRTSHLTS